MPEATGPGLIGQFLEGYMKGSEQAHQRKWQQASALYGMASHLHEMASKETTAEMAALWRNQASKYMEQAEKTMNQKTGAWGLLSKLIGGGGKNKGEIGQDPLSAMSGFAPYGTEETPTHVQPQPAPTPNQGPIPEGGTVPAPQPLNYGGTQLASPPPQQLPSAGLEQPAPLDVSPRGLPMLTPKKAEPGNVAPDDPSAKIGLKMVQVSPGVAQPTLDGQPISADDYKSILMSRSNQQYQWGEKEREIDLELEKQKKLNIFQSQQRVEDWNRLENTPQIQELKKTDPDSYFDIYYNTITNHPPPNRPMRILKTTEQDPATGDVSIHYVDAKTGIPVVPPFKGTPDPHQLKVQQAILNGDAKDVSEAEKFIAKKSATADQLAAIMKQLQATRTAESIEHQKTADAIRLHDTNWRNNTKYYEAAFKDAKAQALKAPGVTNMNSTEIDYGLAFHVFQSILNEQYKITWADVQKALRYTGPENPLTTGGAGKLEAPPPQTSNTGGYVPRDLG